MKGGDACAGPAAAARQAGGTEPCSWGRGSVRDAMTPETCAGPAVPGRADLPGAHV